MKLITSSLLCVSAAVLLASNAKAQLSISFETSENYTAGGTVAGQPNPASGRNQWFFQDTGTTGDLNTVGQVTTAAASVGTQSFAWNPNSIDILGARMNLRLDNASEWGTQGIPNITVGTGDIVDFSFDFQYGATHASSTGEVLNFQIASGAFELSYKADGTLTYFDGTTAVNVKNSGGGNLDVAAGSWLSVNGALNFAAQTYSLRVDGVNQGGTNGFKSTSPSLNPGLRFSAGTVVNVGQPLYLDNIQMSVIPEPSSLLLGLMALGFVINRRRYRR